MGAPYEIPVGAAESPLSLDFARALQRLELDLHYARTKAEADVAVHFYNLRIQSSRVHKWAQRN